MVVSAARLFLFISLPSSLPLSLHPSPPQEYGQVPGYLKHRRQEMEAAQAEYDHYIDESMRRGQMEQISQDERYNHAYTCM